MNIALVGYGVEGVDSYAYFRARGDEVTICDFNTDLQVPDGARTQLGEGYLDNLERFDLVLRSPGIHPRIILESNPNLGDKLTTQLNEFLRVCPSKHTVAVTGTKGKGTTTTLIAKMLEATGKQVALGGNIGIPLFSLLPTISADTWVVLELSSFQLMDVRYSPHIGVCVMVVPEHLNWHADMAEYLQAKSNLFAHQTANDTAIYYNDSDNSRQIASTGQGQKIPYYAEPGAQIVNEMIQIAGVDICSVHDLQLLGQHNWQNVCAAVTAVWYALQPTTEEIPVLTASMGQVLTSFSGLPYHIELVGELDGVAYYNDSFGTTPETAMVAIEALPRPKVVILGGADKKASYDELARTVVASDIRKVLLIGEQAARLQAALEAAGFTNFQPGGSTMSEIVATARCIAQSGDAVLLSPACTSFDMFQNYKDRGQQFTSAVQALA